jgi:hypothetical protein
MRKQFIRVRMKADSYAVVEQMSAILDEYRQQGYVLTVRQLYYQLVARGYIPNNLLSYKRVISILSQARLGGLIDWDMITDRARDTLMPSFWDSPNSILRSAARSYRIDLWANQENHVEVMVEKDALSGVLAPVCTEWRLNFTANKGYTSLSNLYEASQRLLRAVEASKHVIILYLGDHDPSGIDMTRDITDRLDLFTGGEVHDIRRLALNYDQIEQMNPPTNPAKTTDSRYEGYREQFGESSWELDAIDPKTLSGLISGQMSELIDWDAWEEASAREQVERDALKQLADEYKGAALDED